MDTRQTKRPYREAENISLRIDKEMMNEARQESEERYESINNTINRIIRNWYTVYLPARKSGLRFIHKSMLEVIANKLTTDEIIDIAKKAINSNVWRIC